MWWTVVLEKTLESPLDSKEIKSVSLKGNQPWIVIGRTVAKALILILWPPDVKSWLIGKDTDAGKDWRQEEKGRQRMRWLDVIMTQWTWVWASCRRWWRRGKLGMLWSVGSQRVRREWATEQQQQHPWVTHSLVQGICIAIIVSNNTRLEARVECNISLK